MDDLYLVQEPLQGPSTPERFSHSSLTDLNACGLRWWLSRATYSFGRGYPSPSNPAALRGQVIHQALEAFAAHLRKAGFPALGTAAYEESRASFDARSVVREIRAGLLATPPLRGRPIRNDDVPLDNCLSGFKRMLWRAYSAGIDPGRATVTDATEAAPRLAASPATVPIEAEVRVELDDPPVIAFIDQVRTHPNGDHLIDFKSGSPRPEHRAQLDLYAAVWSRARGRHVIRRSIIYMDGDPIELGPVTASDAAHILDQTAREIRRLAADIQGRPRATPSAENCAHCPVRQMCDVYWISPHTEELRWTGAANAADIGWRDVEYSLRNVQVRPDAVTFQTGGQADAFCRIPSKYRPQGVGEFSRVRLLGVGLRQVGAVEEAVWSLSSEAFWIR